MSGIWARVKGWGQRILQLDDTPESISRGVALGVFVGLTPTVGIQMIIIVIMNTILRANRLAGLLLVYISNPLTMLPIYWVDYWVGCLVLQTPSLLTFEKFRQLFELQSSGFVSKFQEFLTNAGALGWDVVGPLFLGGLIVGSLIGFPSYFVSLALIRKERALRAQRKAARMAREEDESEENRESLEHVEASETNS